MSTNVGEGAELFRAVNERILELSEPSLGAAGFICECANEECTGVMRMTLEEYDAMRWEPAFHAVIPGHEQYARSEVVDGTDRYLVVRALGAATVPEVAA